MHRIRELVVKSGKRLKKISEETGIGYSTLGNYNQGSRTPKAKNAQILANYFGVSIPYLLGIDNHYKLPIPQKLTDELYFINLRKAELLREYLELDKQEQDIINQIKEIQK
ncbi:TPA: helix-turn-helix transcriptional regulator [Streptococcus suis]|nr:helix-turn-helix transcriptional regulator [Streptococcus suis]